MKRLLVLFLSAVIIILTACDKDDQPSPQEILQPIQRFTTTTVCTTYNPNGTILSVGTPYNYTVTKESSRKLNFDFHFINFTGDNDTSVNATISSLPYFAIPSQQFVTSNGTNLTIMGQGSQIGDSLNYSWSFYITPNYKSHDCYCKSKKI